MRGASTTTQRAICPFEIGSEVVNDNGTDHAEYGRVLPNNRIELTGETWYGYEGATGYSPQSGVTHYSEDWVLREN